MSTYGLILLISFIIPLIFTFDKNLKFHTQLKFVLKSISIVALIFIIWDIVAVKYNVWDFNHTRVLGFKILGLPIEEILFFFIIPYNLIFIYEVINYYLDDVELEFSSLFFVPIGLIFFALTAVVFEKFYTTSVFLAAGIFNFLLFLDSKRIYASRNFWLSLIITFIPFLIVNFFLTSIPVVFYNDAQNLGLRFVTIPIEDFLYSLVLTGSNYLIYNYFKSNGK